MKHLEAFHCQSQVSSHPFPLQEQQPQAVACLSVPLKRGSGKHEYTG